MLENERAVCFATVRLVPRDSFGQRVEVVKRAFLNTNVKNLCSIATPTLVAANPHDCGGTIAAACYRLLSASCFSQSSTRIPSFGIDLRRYMGPSIAIRSRRRRSMSSRAHRKLPAPSTIVPILRSASNPECPVRTLAKSCGTRGQTKPFASAHTAQETSHGGAHTDEKGEALCARGVLNTQSKAPTPSGLELKAQYAHFGCRDNSPRD